MKKSIKNVTAIAVSMLCMTCCVETGFAGSNVNNTLKAMAISGELETGVQWNFDEKTGILEFCGNGAIPDCNEMPAAYGYSPLTHPSYYEKQGEVRTIKFLEGITTIGNYSCSSTLGDSVTEISLPDGLTSIGTKAFYFIKGMEETTFKTVTIPKSVTYIGEKAIGWYVYPIAINNDLYEEEKVIDGFVIRGYAGTVAEEYAKANGITFEDITGAEITTEPVTEPTTVPEISTEETAKNAIAAYKEAAAICEKIPSIGTAEFALYDMNNDGIPELIEKTGTCEADYIYNFITYRNGTIVNIGSDGGGHSALYRDNETGQLCKRYGQNGIGNIVWYTSDGYTIETKESKEVYFNAENVEDVFATLGSFSRVDSSHNYRSAFDGNWQHLTPTFESADGYDLSIFDRYDVTDIPSDENDKPAPVVTTEPASSEQTTVVSTVPANSEQTTAVSDTTKKADTTTNPDGKTSSPKTGSSGIALAGTVGLLAGVATLIFRKKKK